MHAPVARAVRISARRVRSGNAIAVARSEPSAIVAAPCLDSDIVDSNILDSNLAASERRDSDKKRATNNLLISSHAFPPFLYLSLRHSITAAENNTMRISQVCSHIFEFVRRVVQS